MEKGDEIDTPGRNPPEKEDTIETPPSKNIIDEKTPENDVADHPQLIPDISTQSSGNETPSEIPIENGVSKAPPSGENTEAKGDVIESEAKIEYNENNQLGNDMTSSVDKEPVPTESPTATDTANSDADTVASSSPRDAKSSTKTPPNSETEPDLLDDLPPGQPHFNKPTNFQIPATYFAGLHRHYEHYHLFVRMIAGDVPLAPNVESRHEAELQASKRSHVINKQIDEMLAIVDADNKQYVRLLAMRAIMNLEDAKLVHREGETELAKQILWQTIQRSVKHVLEPEMTYAMLRIMNHMAYYMMQEGNYGVPKDLMEQAEKIYLTLNCYKSSQKKALIYYTEWELFSEAVSMASTQEGYEKSERLVTHNIELLSHIYYREGNDTMYAISQHRVLNRQLYMKDGDPLAWTRKCMSVGHFFVAKNQFSAARLHLAGATRILEEYVGEFHPDAQSVISLPSELVQCCETIAKSWVTYSIALFADSRRQILENYYKGVHRDDEKREAFIRSHMISTAADDIVAKFQSLFNTLNDDPSVRKLFQDGCGDETVYEDSDDRELTGRENRGQGEGSVLADASKKKGDEMKDKEVAEEESSEENTDGEEEQASEEEEDKENGVDTADVRLKKDSYGMIVTKEVYKKNDDFVVVLDEERKEFSFTRSKEDLEKEEGNGDDKGERVNGSGESAGAEEESRETDDDEGVVVDTEDEGKESVGTEDEEKASVGTDNGDKASGDTDNEEKASVGTDNEEKASGDSEDEEKASVSTEDEEKASVGTDNGDKASGDSDNEGKASVSTEDEEKASGDSDNEGKASVSSEDEEKASVGTEDEEKASEDTDNEEKASVGSEDEEKTSVGTEDDDDSDEDRSSEEASVKILPEEGEVEDEDEVEKRESEQLMDKLFQFKLLMLDDILAEVPCTLIDNENDAHRLFNHAKNWLRRVIAHTDVVTSQDEYLDCVMDMCELYRMAAFYETDPATRFYILRDRQHTLEIITAVLRDARSPSFIHLGVELMRELTEVRLEMLELSRPGLSGRRFLHRKRAGMRYIHSRLVDTAAALGRNEIVARFLKQDPALLDGHEVPVGSEMPLAFQDV